MEENIKVSVIVPVYNGEDFIEETLKCIINQSCKEIEIIVVDDGSIDNTAKIVKQYMEMDARIRYYYQDKSNAGATRNYGMKHATGKYYMFLDADDLFEETLVEEMFCRAEAKNAEICICAADQYDQTQDVFIPQKQYLVTQLLPEDDVFSKDTFQEHIFNFTTVVPWNKIFLSDFIKQNKLEFQSIERANDQYFVMMAMAVADRITTLNKVLVHYRINQTNNLTNTFSDSAMCKYEAFLGVKKELEKRKILENEVIRRSFVNKALNSMIYGLNIQTDIDGFQKMFKMLKEKGFEQLDIRDYGEEYYFNIKEYENYKAMMENDCFNYLLIKNREYRNTIKVKNYQYNQLRKSETETKKQLKAAEKKIYDIENRKSYKIMRKCLKVYYKITGK